MATANTTTKTTSETTGATASETLNEMPALAQKLREQLVSNVQQSQKLSLDAAQTWVKVVSVLPGSMLPNRDMPKIPGLPAMPGMEAATKYTFDVATDLLNAQRNFALQLTSALAPAKTT